MAFVNNNGMHQSSTTIADNELLTSEDISRRLEQILLNWRDETHTILDKFKADLKSDLKAVLRQSISAMVDASSLEPGASSTLSDFLPTTPNQEKETTDSQEFIRFHESSSRIDLKIAVFALDIEEFGSVDKVLEEGTVVAPSKCQEIAPSMVVRVNENPCLGVYNLFDEMSRRDLEVFGHSKHIGSKEDESYFNEVGGILLFDPGGLNSIEFLVNLSAHEVFVETPQRKVLSTVTRGSVLELIAYQFPYDRGKYKLLISSEDESLLSWIEIVGKVAQKVFVKMPRHDVFHLESIMVNHALEFPCVAGVDVYKHRWEGGISVFDPGINVMSILVGVIHVSVRVHFRYDIIVGVWLSNDHSNWIFDPGGDLRLNFLTRLKLYVEVLLC